MSGEKIEKKKISPSLIISVVVIIVLLAALVYYATLPPKVEVVPITVVQTALRTETLPGTTIVRTEERTVVQTVIPTTPTTTTPMGPITLRFWHTYSAHEEKKARELLDEFEKENPGIKIEMEYVPYHLLYQKMITLLAAGEVPCDLARYDIIFTPELAELGVLIELDDYMKKAGIKPEDFFSGPMETCVWKGKTYGLPLNTCTKALFYRKDMLESVGVKPPKTWEELIDVAKKLTKDVDGDGEIDVWGFVYDGAWSWHFNPFLWQAGGMELSPDKKECVINNEEGIRALQFLLDLIYVHKVAPPPEKWKWGIEAIAKGEGAMAIDGPWGWACAHDLFGLDVDKYLGVTLLPKGPVREASVTGGENIVIPKFTKHPNEAFKVAQYMVSYHFQVEMIKADVFPTLKAAAMDPLIKENPLWSVFAKQMEVALPRAVHPAYGKINEIIHTYLEKAFYRELSAKEALDTIKVEVDKLLKGG